MSAQPLIPWNTPGSWALVNGQLRTALADAAPRLSSIRTEADRLLAEMVTVAEHQQRLAAATCPWCPLLCCQVATVWFDRCDLVLSRLMGLPAPPGQPRPDPNHPCGYLGPRGCRLPRLHRPWICTRYLCATQRLRLRGNLRRDKAFDLQTTVARLTTWRRNLTAAAMAVIGNRWEGLGSHMTGI